MNHSNTSDKENTLKYITYLRDKYRKVIDIHKIICDTMLKKECIDELQKTFLKQYMSITTEDILDYDTPICNDTLHSSIFPHYSNNAGRRLNFLTRLVHYDPITDSNGFIYFLIENIKYTETELYETIVSCIKMGNEDVLNILINNNKNISTAFIKKHLGEFILLSSKNGCVGILELLLAHLDDIHLDDIHYNQVNYKDAETGNTALMIASKRNYRRFLDNLKQTADKTIKNNTGKTAYDYNPEYWTPPPDKYVICRVEDWFGEGKKYMNCHKIQLGDNPISNILVHQQRVAQEFVKLTKKRIQKIGSHTNIIAPYYDKLYIIKETESMIKYNGEEYYDMRDIRYEQPTHNTKWYIYSGIVIVVSMCVITLFPEHINVYL